MRDLHRVAFALALALCAGLAHAQKNLGDLLDKGAHRLTRDELVRVLRDATARGMNATDAEVSIDYRADGSVIGALLPRRGSASGETTGIYGTWSVEDDGKLCVSSTKVGEGRASAACGFYFRLGGAYYVSPSDSDPKARILKRAIERR